jgi:hypothetical protein
MDIDADHRPQPCLPERAAVRRQDLALRSRGLGDSALVRAQWAKRCGAGPRFLAHLYYSARRGRWDRVADSPPLVSNRRNGVGS